VIDLTLSLAGLDAFETRMNEAIDDALQAAVERGADVIAYAAKADHPYQDRTGDLTGSIEALPAIRAAEGVRGGVLAGMDYAAYVDARMPFLDPAARRSEDRIEHELDQLIHDAMRRAT
jgi:methylmalonyl-CoA mutase cobalamin-binding subunit